METFKIIYTALGGLGIFFYGMKMMSDALQQAASDVITKVINSLTSNRFLAVVVGMIVTMIVQSSSVTTVMVVGFVNAGLMQLTQAIGVIFGSNIGTTVTGWIISIKVGKYGLLFIGLGIFPAIFAKSSRIQHIGRVLFGVGMIFMGLEIMSGAFKPLRSSEDFLSFLSYFNGDDYLSYAASILVGCMLTVVIQSSSAMLGITIALASTGVIGFNTGAALILGENIGTTITALLASVGTSINAKRAARAHAIFNLLGVVILFIFLPLWLEFVERIVPGFADFQDAEGNRPNVAQHLAASHTMFNIFATIAFLPLLNPLAKLVTKITPDRSAVKEKPHLVVVGEASEMMPATSIAQADSEVKKMKEIVDRAFKVTDEYIIESSPERLAKIRDYERITDNIQKEVTLFLCAVMERPMSAMQTRKTAGLIKVADELESITDYLERIASYKSRFKADAIVGSSIDEFMDFKSRVKDFYDYCLKCLVDPNQADLEEAYSRSEELRVRADDIRDHHLERVSKGQYEPLTALTYSDMVVALRKIRAHSLNIVEACNSYKSHDH